MAPTNQAEFDQHIQNYRSNCDSCLKLSGETSTYFAALEWVNATEGQEVVQKVAERMAKFTLHNIATITPKDNRLVYNAESYEIVSCTPIDNDKFIELYCRVKDNENVN